MGQNALPETQEGDLLLEEDSTPQLSVFCLSGHHLPHTHTTTHFSHSPALLLCLLLSGTIFILCKPQLHCGQRPLLHIRREAEERLLISLRKSCNCSFLPMPLSAGAYTCNPRYGCLTPPSSSSQMWHTEVGERVRNTA